MAAASEETEPEWFKQVGGDPDGEPFSPSLFLDLPPSPRDVVVNDDDDDDDVLPFISRMLMEDDIDDKFFYEHPDLLLHAQQPYHQILLSSANDSTTSTITDTSSSAAAAAANSSSSAANAATTDSSSSATANATTTWPYHPIELSQLLQSPPHPDDLAAFLSPNGAAAEQEEEESPASDADLQGALAEAFYGGKNLDMLNKAFLKGMEEANKFLPTTTNNLLFDPKPDMLVKKEEEEVVMFGARSSNGRGRKNRHDVDELEAEAGRNTKLLTQDMEGTDEVGARQMLDEFTMDGFNMCIREMEGLRIAMAGDTDNGNKKGKGKKKNRRRSSDDAVDLCMLLTHCAQSVATDDRRGATDLLRQIRQHASPTGDAMQRVAIYFADGLEARMAGTGSQVYCSLMAKRTSVLEVLKSYRMYMAACCFEMIAFKFSSKTIIRAVAGRRKVHIVDYGVGYGFQWPGLLRMLGAREGGPPEVRITGIDLPQPGFRPGARIEETGRRLSNCAREFGVPFKFHSIAAKWETIHAEDINIDPDELLIVNGLFHFGSLMDESIVIDSPSPRNMVLNNIRKMRPDVFIQCVANGTYNAPFFVTRFREALFYFSALFDMLDATTPRDNEQRLFVERYFFGQCALNIVACEGLDRVERPETYKQWQVRNHRAGLRQLPLDPDLVKIVREVVRNHYHKDFVIDMDHQWLLEGWKGRVLYAMSTWVADDASRDI